MERSLYTLHHQLFTRGGVCLLRQPVPKFRPDPEQLFLAFLNHPQRPIVDSGELHHGAFFLCEVNLSVLHLDPSLTSLRLKEGLIFAIGLATGSAGWNASGCRLLAG